MPPHLVQVYASLDVRNWRRLVDVVSLSPQNLLNALNFAFIALTRHDVAICARADTNVRRNARHAIGVNSRVAIVNGLGNF